MDRKTAFFEGLLGNFSQKAKKSFGIIALLRYFRSALLCPSCGFCAFLRKKKGKKKELQENKRNTIIWIKR